MDININIHADETALEFAREMGKVFLNFGIADPDAKPKKNYELEQMEKETAELSKGMPWEPGEPDLVPGTEEPIEPIESDSAAASASYSKEEVRKALNDFKNENGREAMKLLFEKLGISKFPQLKESDYALAMELINA